MKRWLHRLIVSCVLFVFVGCGAATPELQLLEDAAEAMGSLRAVSETTGVVLEGSGRTYRLGQNATPRADLPYYEIENYLLQLDFANQRWQLRQDRTTTFLTGNPLYGVRQTFGLDGDVAYDEQGDATVRASDRVAAERWGRDVSQPPRHHPARARRDLDGEQSAGGGRAAGRRHRGPPTGPSSPCTSTGPRCTPAGWCPPRYHPVLGDVSYETVFEDYAEAGGLGGFQARLTLPRSYTINLGEDTIAEYRVSSDTQAQIGDLSAPDAEPASTEVVVESEEVADGVWHLTGGSHHSALIEFDDFLALVEAPQSEARTLAVIEHARGLQPGENVAVRGQYPSPTSTTPPAFAPPSPRG